MELKKKNTDVDEIKEKLKKYYKLYVSTGSWTKRISSVSYDINSIGKFRWAIGIILVRPQISFEPQLS